MIYLHIYNMVDHVFFRSSLSSMIFVSSFSRRIWRDSGNTKTKRCIPRQSLRGKEDPNRWNLGTKRVDEASLPMMDDVAWCWLICFFNPNFKTATWHTHTRCDFVRLGLQFSYLYYFQRYTQIGVDRWFCVPDFLCYVLLIKKIPRLVKSWMTGWDDEMDGPEVAPRNHP